MKHDFILISVLLFFIIWLEAKKYMLQEEFEDFKASTKKMFEDKGIDINLDDIKITDNFDDVLKIIKLF